MAENIAVVKKKQKTFKKSVDNYKKKLKTGEITIEENAEAQKKTSTVRRGVVYLSNIPHGFYEEEMQQYFTQFGSVKRLRLIRSKKTGQSRGHAFIEFKIPEVAEIVAETMNNYLMGKRLLKAKYISPDDQRGTFFKGIDWTANNYPKLKHRSAVLKRNRAKKTETEILTETKKRLSGINKIKKKLSEIGINYDFQPADVPDNVIPLKEKPEKTSEPDETEEVVESDESGIIFQPQPAVKKITKEKSMSPDFTETKKEKNMVPKISDKKTSGISKKTKQKKIVPTDKESQKLKLMQKNISENNQVNLKTLDDIKNKKRSRRSGQKSPKIKKSPK